MKKYILPLLVLTIFSCKRADQDYDASGTFEADEIIVTAEATGKSSNSISMKEMH